ncbi:MAG: EAL domain-containing response regulator [Alphaproteobacteria bacterium]|nr:EAL domain-containing response regulator [Alphaproteobacteria bacterium]
MTVPLGTSIQAYDALRPRVVAVDDDPLIRELICSVAGMSGCDSAQVSSLSELDPVLDAGGASDLIVLDLDLGATDGVNVLRHLHDRHCRSPIVIASGCHARVVQSAVDVGQSFGLTMLAPLAKPFAHGELAAAVKKHSASHAVLTPEDVEKAIWNGEIAVHMQPIVDVMNGHAAGAKALVRWNHPTRGLLRPDQFIPMVEKLPLMLPLTMEIAGQAVRSIAGCPAVLQTSINVPPVCLADPSFPDLLADLAAASGLAPTRMTVEITETAAMEDPAFTAAQVTRLRIKGFQVALDDFGTGYASLVELHRMPVSEIKIDRSFVMSMSTDRSAQAIVRSIVGLGRNLDLRVIAEGVENLEVLRLLQAFECDLAQGYHFARPMPATDLAKWARD